MKIARINPFFSSGRLRHIFYDFCFSELGRVQGSCVYDGTVLTCARCVFSKFPVFQCMI